MIIRMILRMIIIMIMIIIIYIYTNRNNGEIISMSLAPKRSPGLCALRSLRSHRNAAEELGGHRVVAAGRGDAQRSARNSAVSW